MAKKGTTGNAIASAPPSGKPSALLDTRVVYCGDNLEQLAKLPDQCIELVYIDSLHSKDAEHECAAFPKRTGRIMNLLTVQEILDEEHVQTM